MLIQGPVHLDLKLIIGKKQDYLREAFKNVLADFAR